MDSLFEQMANISKAHAYDIVSKQVQEQQVEIKTILSTLRTLNECVKPFVNPEISPSIGDTVSLMTGHHFANDLLKKYPTT